MLSCSSSEFSASQGDLCCPATSGGSANNLNELFVHLNGGSGSRILSPVLSSLTDCSEERRRIWRSVLRYFMALDICATSYKNTACECCLWCSSWNRLKRAHGLMPSWMKKYIKELLPFFSSLISFILPLFFILFGCVVVFFFFLYFFLLVCLFILWVCLFVLSVLYYYLVWVFLGYK